MVDNALARLVERAKLGDQEALTELLRRFQPLIRACCRGLQVADGRDLEQELYIQLILLVRRYKPCSSMPFDRFIEENAQGGDDNA